MSTLSNPSADYSEVQNELNVRKAQSSTAEEAEAGVKVRVHSISSSQGSLAQWSGVQLVPRPEDVTSFESAAEPDPPVGGASQKGAEQVGRSQDYDSRQRAQREREVSAGRTDQRRTLS